MTARLHIAVDMTNLKGDWRGITRYVRAVLPRLSARDDVRLTKVNPGWFGYRVPRSADVVWHPANGTFFASRAPSVVTIHDAVPFMRTARLTTIVAVNGERGESRVRIPGADIATVIARHGIRVEVKNLDLPAGKAVGDTLLSEADTLGADLLVMGAYGHARWQELVMGGATRTILKSMTVPVLMSH